MLHTIGRAAVCVLLLTLCGCSKPTQSPERLVEAAFAAIKANDWKAYAPLTITSADIMLTRDKVSPMQAKMSYAGDVLKPEEQKRHRAQFDKAVSGGPGVIDFGKVKFQRAVKVAAADQELWNGSSVSVVFYGVALKGGTGDVSQLDPGFSVVQFGDGYRLLALVFRPQEPAQQ
jgi:hypothetical protein